MNVSTVKRWRIKTAIYVKGHDPGGPKLVSNYEMHNSDSLLAKMHSERLCRGKSFSLKHSLENGVVALPVSVVVSIK